jgi:hypothetical protein
LSKARRLEDAQDAGDDAAQADYTFLSDYKLKLIGCTAGEVWKNPEDGESEYSSVVFRLCPSADCDDEVANGCKKGYGDFIVGINTFTDAWLEDKREDMQQDDDHFNIDEYSECREWEVDNDDDGNADGGDVYYVGPACDGSGIKLGFFSDDTCTTVPNGVSFEDISNGWTLPYSSGGLVTNYCEACAGYNDNGEYEVSDMCAQLYEWSGKCMSNMDMSNTGYSADTTYCESITSLMPVTKSNVGKAIGWTIFVLVLLGLGGFLYTKWWTKKKQGGGEAMSSSDGAMA